MAATKKEMKELIVSILDDDYGASKRTYMLLCRLATKYKLEDLLNNVDATDGRFYTPEPFVE